MPFNGSGVYSPPSPEFPAVAGNVIYSAEFNTIITDIATALAKALLIDGQNQMEANLKLNGFRVTGIGDGIADTDAISKSQLDAALTGVTAAVPPGAIIAWIGGYFGANDNSGFTNVLGNTVANANAYLNPFGWYVCNGAVLNESNSPIFNGANRYLPNISDSRFIMGNTIAGSSGADTHSHTLSHTHSLDITTFWSEGTSLTIDQLAAHSHTYSAGPAGGVQGMFTPGSSVTGTIAVSSTGSGNAHYHQVNPPATTSSEASTTTTSTAAELRPKFLSCLYIIKVL